jgi:hypothetical protein
MIHESIDPKNNTRVLINLNQVAHITITRKVSDGKYLFHPECCACLAEDC